MENTVWRILMVDDDREDYILVRQMLAEARQGKFLLEWASSLDQGEQIIQTDYYDAILVDYDLGAASGLDLVRKVVEAGCEAPILLLTGRGDYEVDLEAMQAGASDYLNKNDLTPVLLERSIRFAIEHKRLLEENQRQRDLLERIMQDSLTAVAVLHGPQHRYILVNPAYEAITRKGDLLGRTVAEAWSEIAAQILPLLDGVYQTGQPFRAVDQPFDLIRDRGLERVYYSFTYAPLYDRSGQVEGIVVTADETTAQVRDRQKLVEGEKILRSFFESETILAGIIELHADDIYYVQANHNLVAFFGLPAEQVVGKYGRELGIDEATLANWVRHYEQCYASQTPDSFEFSIQYQAQEGRYFATISPVGLSAAGKPRFAMVAVDVTERHRNEQRLVTERNRLSAILQALPVGVSICDEKGGVLLTNQEFDQIWRGERPETKSVADYHAYKAWWVETGELLRPEEWASAQVLSKKEPVLGQFLQVERFDGSRAYVINSAAPILDAEGKLVGSVVAIQDITQQAETEQELRIAEERFRVALQNTPVVVFSQDTDLRYTWIHNPRAPFVTESVLGKRDDELLEPDAAAVLTAPKEQVLASGQSLSREVTYSIAGQTVVYDLTLEPLKDRNGMVIGLTGAAMDLTMLRRLEAEQFEHAAQVEVQRRLMQQRELERMQIARDLHDGVLQELTAMGFALAEAISLDDKQARLERLQWVQATLMEQSGEIRAFCNNLRPPALAPFGLEKAIRSYADDYQKRNPQVEVHVDLQSDRQSLPEEVRMAFFRIFQEVLNNITKHAKARQVWVQWTLDEGSACLKIEDDGAGFIIPHDWVTQARSGHLGLIGMRERAAAVGASIQFNSQPGQGTQVSVCVPRCVQTNDPAGELAGTRVQSPG